MNLPTFDRIQLPQKILTKPIFHNRCRTLDHESQKQDENFARKKRRYFVGKKTHEITFILKEYFFSFF